MVASLIAEVLLTDDLLVAIIVVSFALLLLILYLHVTTHERYFSPLRSLLALHLPYQLPSPQVLVLLNFPLT